jgi:hypothetical protein
MNDENDKFEKIREFFSNSRSHFCLIFRRKPNIIRLRLQWCKAASSDNKTHEEYDKLAATYQEIAFNSYRHKRNFIIKETVSGGHTKTQRWCGFDISVTRNENQPPANSRGKRWWQFVVGSGAIRDAGYVIVARVAARDASEVRDYINQIQRIMEGEKLH